MKMEEKLHQKSEALESISQQREKINDSIISLVKSHQRCQMRYHGKHHHSEFNLSEFE